MDETTLRLASNASELVSSLHFAAKKRKKNISLTYSQVYGAVTMNNTMCLGLFMIVIHAQGLEWTFTSAGFVQGCFVTRPLTTQS